MDARQFAVPFTSMEPITISDDETVEEDSATDLDGLGINTDDDLDEIEADEAYENSDVPQGLFNNHALRPGQKFIAAQASPAGLIITPGTTVEMTERNFFHVKQMIRNSEGSVSLFGFRLVRPCDIEFKVSKNTGQPVARFFPQQVNELVAFLRVQKGKKGGIDGDLMLEEVPIAAVTGLRDIIFTNKNFPAHSYRESGMSVGRKDEFGNWHGRTHTPAEIERLAGPVCRIKYVEEIDMAKKSVVAWQAAYLRANECSPGRSIPDELKSRDHLGQMHAYSTGTHDTPIEIADKVYKFGDLCAGLGCVSRAATQVGLEIKWVLDHWDIACRNLEANFGREKCFELSIDDFLTPVELGKDNWAEIIHFSPPCQGHSYLNRGTNPETDATNNAVGYALGDVLKRRKPRRMTMEQTRGIMTKNEGQHFRQIINMFLNEGYSVRWTVLYAWDYSEVQRRPRFFALASCPGEQLPDFPKPTHGPGLQPYVTINERLATIDAQATHHDPAAMRGKGLKYPVADGNKPLTALMKTSGIQFRHPSGLRGFTPREHMALIGLPNHHELFYTKQRHWKTLTGNGVPVGEAEACLEMVVKSLRETDAENEAFFNSAPITVDDEDDGIDHVPLLRPRKPCRAPEEPFEQPTEHLELKGPGIPSHRGQHAPATKSEAMIIPDDDDDDDDDDVRDVEPLRPTKRRQTSQPPFEQPAKQTQTKRDLLSRRGQSAGLKQEQAILIPEDEDEIVVAQPNTSIHSQQPTDGPRLSSAATFGSSSPAVYDLTQD